MTAFSLGPFCALMSSVTWAMGSAGYSRLARRHSAFAVNFSRGLVAFPLFFLSALIAAAIAAGAPSGAWDAFRGVEPRHFGWFTVSMLASYAIGDSLFLISSQTIGVPTALTICSSYPLLTASWGALVQGELLSLSQTIGLLITVAGIATVILSAPQGSIRRVAETAASRAGGEGTEAKVVEAAPMQTRMGKRAAIALAFGSAFCWATNSYCVMQGGQGVSASVGNTIRMGMAILLCAAIGKIALPKAPVFLPLNEYRKWLWLFILEGFGGSYFFIYGLSHSPLAIGSTLAAVAPVISVPVSLALGLESFSWKRTAGVVTVVFGLWLLVGGLNSPI